MIIDIALIKKLTFWSHYSYIGVPHSDRGEDENLQDYLARILEEKAAFITQGINSALNNRQGNSECLFVTVPEFYWNAPWDALRSKEELEQLVDYYMSNLSTKVMDVIKQFNPEECGKIVLLAGSVGLPVYIESESVYESLNYLLMTNNWRYTNEGLPELSMWPKRYVSINDYGEGEEVVVDGNSYYQFPLKGITMKMKTESTVVAEQNSVTGYGPVFGNDVLNNMPFSLNLCLDYLNVPEDGRNDELEDTGVKVDFLVACGMTFSETKAYPQTTQFAFRNDGLDKEAEARRVENGYICGDNLPHKNIDDVVLYTVNME